jgi:hypothetical protein
VQVCRQQQQRLWRLVVRLHKLVQRRLQTGCTAKHVGRLHPNCSLAQWGGDDAVPEKSFLHAQTKTAPSY